MPWNRLLDNTPSTECSSDPRRENNANNPNWIVFLLEVASTRSQTSMATLQATRRFRNECIAVPTFVKSPIWYTGLSSDLAKRTKSESLYYFNLVIIVLKTKTYHGYLYSFCLCLAHKLLRLLILSDIAVAWQILNVNGSTSYKS